MQGGDPRENSQLLQSSKLGSAVGPKGSARLGSRRGIPSPGQTQTHQSLQLAEPDQQDLDNTKNSKRSKNRSKMSGTGERLDSARRGKQKSSMRDNSGASFQGSELGSKAGSARPRESARQSIRKDWQGLTPGATPGGGEAAETDRG